MIKYDMLIWMETINDIVCVDKTVLSTSCGTHYLFHGGVFMSKSQGSHVIFLLDKKVVAPMMGYL